MASANTVGIPVNDYIAQMAYKLADAMLAARKVQR